MDYFVQVKENDFVEEMIVPQSNLVSWVAFAHNIKVFDMQFILKPLDIIKITKNNHIYVELSLDGKVVESGIIEK